MANKPYYNSTDNLLYNILQVVDHGSDPGGEKVYYGSTDQLLYKILRALQINNNAGNGGGVNYYINVKNFGALGNGVDDDSQPIKDALDAAEAKGGGIVEFPSGIYISDPFSIPTGVILVGEGECDLPFYTGNDITQKRTGTIILFNAAAGQWCVTLPVNSHNNGAEKMSLYNTNTNAIGGIVKISNGSLYPKFFDVEVGSTVVSPGTGWYLEGSVLYGRFINAQAKITGVNESYESSLRYGLRFKSLSPTERPNSNTFIGGHFTGKKKSLFIEASAGQGLQGLGFIGTGFEGTYNSTMEHEYVADGRLINGLNSDPAYAFKWIEIQQAQAVNFTGGCYFECSGYTDTYNDGTHGVKQLYPVIELGSGTTFIYMDDVVPISRILDRGYLNQTADTLRKGNANGVGLIKYAPVGNAAAWKMFANNFTDLDDVGDLEVYGDLIKVKGKIELGLPDNGDAYEDHVMLRHSDGRMTKCTPLQFMQSNWGRYTTTDNDIEITQANKGFILKSEDGTRRRFTMNNDGSLTSTVI